MSGAQAAVELSGIYRRFGDVYAVHGLDLDIAHGEFFSLIGPSGCGKTTTLRMIAGLDHPTAGSIRVGGADITNDPAHRRPVNTVFQNYALFPHLTVFENVAFGLRERRRSRREIESRVHDMLELVHLTGKDRERPDRLSGGQQQRVALARALVLEPSVLLLDEPLAALDLKLRRQMQRLLREVQREIGITFIYVTHDQEEAFSMSTRVGVMNAGVLEQVAEPQVVYRRPISRFVADFVGAVNLFPVTVMRVLEDGRYEVALTGRDGTFCAYGPAGLETGSAMHVVIRRECMALNDPSRGEVSFNGRVIDMSYTGPHTQLRVEIDGVGSLLVATRGDEAADATLGDQVAVSWGLSACWLVPEDPSVSTATEGDHTTADAPAPRSASRAVGATSAGAGG